MNNAVHPRRVTRLATISIVVLGTLLLFRLRRFRPEALPELIALAAAPVVMVALLRRSWREVAIWAAFMGGLVAFAFLRAGADDIGFSVRVDYVIVLERRLFGFVPTVWLQQRLYTPGTLDTFDWSMTIVHLSYFVVPHALAFFFWAYRPQYFVRFLLAMTLTYYAGLIGYVLIPTAPPWYAGQYDALPIVYRIVDDALYGLSPAAYEHGMLIVGENDVAAMPSLHSAISIIVALAAAQVSGAAAYISWLYAASMVFALVYLGEHYVVDALAGALLAAVIWRATRTAH